MNIILNNEIVTKLIFKLKCSNYFLLSGLRPILLPDDVFMELILFFIIFVMFLDNKNKLIYISLSLYKMVTVVCT